MQFKISLVLLIILSYAKKSSAFSPFGGFRLAREYGHTFQKAQRLPGRNGLGPRYYSRKSAIYSFESVPVTRNFSLSEKKTSKSQELIGGSSAEELLAELRDAKKSSKDFARILQAAANRRIQFSAEAQRAVVTMLYEHVGNMSPHAVAVTVWSLGQLEFPEESRSHPELCDMFVEKLAVRCSELGPADVFRTFVGLARLGVQWRLGNAPPTRTGSFGFYHDHG